MAILAEGVDPTRALILSQLALSFGIPFALVIALNGFLLVQTFTSR